MKGYDVTMGGFSRAPKFPQPVNFNFLFRNYAIMGSNDDYAKQGLKMVLHTLQTMAKGMILELFTVTEIRLIVKIQLLLHMHCFN